DGAIGLALGGVDVGLAFFKENTLAGILPRKYTALKITAATAGLVGGGDFLTVDAKNISIGVNQVSDPLATLHILSPKPAINFGEIGRAAWREGFEVSTGGTS